MGDSAQTKISEASELQNLWNQLIQNFKLDELHKNETVLLKIEDETLNLILNSGNTYKAEKRMFSEIQWRMLTDWCKSKIIEDIHPIMPRKLPKISDSESIENMSDNEEETKSDEDKEGEIEEAKVQENKDELNRSDETMDEKMARFWEQLKQQTLKERIDRQENKISELTRLVTKLCNVSIQSIIQQTKITNLIIQQLNNIEEEKKQNQPMVDLIQLVRDDCAQQGFKLNKIVESIVEVQKKMLTINKQDEPARNQTSEIKVIKAPNYVKKGTAR
ncbi:uncharacterized protein LOC122511556 isoform X2 [Leptopilina heterotoma]|uniref:uncharacterized protein LOC122511556 isoform X2 n=1 Tax=Leptopilina heterotoma TaxID=63436 RepID=UPI001CAA0F1D|nr:uncharacterized protein LOC122511556 isoform X2 [Leptopilina heterotoma]